MVSKRVASALSILIIIALSGCFGSPELYTYQAGGVNPADVNDSFEVKTGKAAIAFQVGGVGSATVKVTDADGVQQFSRTFSGSGGDQAGKEMSGAPGTWHITIDFGQWSGGFQVVVSGA